ncbi:MAG: 6-hydroxymethylpterin diphosphokinase MptE-like protein [Thermodesulfobacteriota bacterium]
MEADGHFLENNTKLLQQHHPRVWEALKRYADEPIGEIRLAGEGKPTLWMKDDAGAEYFLHDTKNPEAELKDFFALVPENTTGTVIFVGMGLGYAPLAMLRSRTRMRHMLILEPKTGFFLQALRALDLGPLLTDSRVTFAVGPDINVPACMQPMSRALLLESTHILNHLSSARIFPQIYQNLYDEVYKQGNTLNVGGLTIRTFGRKFIENRLRHLSAIHHQHLLEHLLGAFSGKPAIIVAGGPSLNNNIHHLCAAKGKAVIIAVDTVLPALLAHGISPDFTTAIDMQDIVMEKIVDVSDRADTSLVCASWVSPTIPKIFPARQVYWAFAAKHMEKWISDMLGGRFLTNGAGTVAHLNMTTALLLGCSPIIFVGQDLAYTNRQDHAGHTSLTQKDDLTSLYERNEIQWVDGYGGQKVPTTRGWLSDKHHFEWMIAANPDRRFINSTEGGVRIEGAEEIDLRTALSTWCLDSIDIPAIIDKSHAGGKMPGRRKMMEEVGRLLRNIAGIEKDMDQLAAVSAKLQKEFTRLRNGGSGHSCFDSLPMELKRQVHTLDTLNDRLDKSIVWALLDEVTMEGLLQSERLNHELRQLEGRPEKYLEWIGKSIERFLLINRCRGDVLKPFKQQLKTVLERLRRENLLLKKLQEKDPRSGRYLLELLSLYYEDGDHVLLQRAIEAIDPKEARNAEISFYLGAVAAHQSLFEKAESRFAEALALDASLAARIEDCRRRLADRYITFSREWERNDRDVARRLLFKGLRHCPGHPVLGKTLAGQAAELLRQADEAAEKKTPAPQAEAFRPWCEALTAIPGLVAVIGAEKAALLYRHYGHGLVAENRHARAAEAFAAAADLSPDDPALYIFLADAAFAADDPDRGVACLDKAVSLDRRYAQFWETMGDNLAAAGQPRDAVSAYERCLLTMPEHFILFKKIGDCYMAMEQPQAALTAYRHFKAKTTGNNPAGPDDSGLGKEVSSHGTSC